MEMKDSNIELNIQNLALDKSIKDILLHLAQEIQCKSNEINDLKSRVNYLEAKSNELERYLSKDTIIIKNLPIGYQNSLLHDVILFFKLVFHMDLTPRDIKACHPLGPVRDFNQPPPIVIKFVYYEHKQQVWFRKNSLLRGFKHPKNGRKVWVSERMSKTDMDVYFEAKRREIETSSLNSVPMIKIKQFNGDEKFVKVNTMKDLDDLEHISIKRSQLKQPPQYQAKPPLKRSRVESPPKSMENDTLIELKKRLNNVNDLADFVRGLVSDSPLSKQNAVDHQEVPGNNGSCSGDEGLQINKD